MNARLSSNRPALAVLIAALGAAAGVRAEDRGVSYSPFPTISYAPETSAVFGGLLVIGFDLPGEPALARGRVRRSSVTLIGAYSLENQFRLSADPRLYFAADTWRLDGNTNAIQFPDRFFELGPDSRESTEEDYTSRELSGDVGVSRLIFRDLRAGARLLAFYIDITESETSGLLDSGQVRGGSGGAALGFGPELTWDTRDHDRAPRRGQYHRVRAHFFPDFAGDFDYAIASADARFYAPVWRDHVLATQVTARFTTGEAPFQALSELGGSVRMRGFVKGRYRDRHRLDAQVEYRAPIWWRLHGAGFVAAGEVAPAIADFGITRVRLAAGGGIRVALSRAERVRIRLDLGVTSEGDVNGYLRLNEAF